MLLKLLLQPCLEFVVTASGDGVGHGELMGKVEGFELGWREEEGEALLQEVDSFYEEKHV